MTLEVTDYRAGRSFGPSFTRWSQPTPGRGPSRWLHRIGLRCINEIRASLAEPSGWAYWVAESLLGPGAQRRSQTHHHRAQRHVIQCEGRSQATPPTGTPVRAALTHPVSPTFLQRLKEPPAKEISSSSISTARGRPARASQHRRPPGGRGRRKAPRTHRPTVRIADASELRTGAATAWARSDMFLRSLARISETTPPLATAITASTNAREPPHRPRCSTAPMPKTNSRNSTGKPAATHGRRRTWLSWSLRPASRLGAHQPCSRQLADWLCLARDIARVVGVSVPTNHQMAQGRWSYRREPLHPPVYSPSSTCSRTDSS